MAQMTLPNESPHFQARSLVEDARSSARRCQPGHVKALRTGSAVLAVSSPRFPLKGSFKVDIGTDVEVDVDIDRYFACLKGVSKSYRSSCGTDFDNSEIAGPVAGGYLERQWPIIEGDVH